MSYNSSALDAMPPSEVTLVVEKNNKFHKIYESDATPLSKMENYGKLQSEIFAAIQSPDMSAKCKELLESISKMSETQIVIMHGLHKEAEGMMATAFHGKGRRTRRKRTHRKRIHRKRTHRKH